MDYLKELKNNPDMPAEDRQDYEKLAAFQRDAAIGASAEDFIRHPFFKYFENEMNDMIADSKNKIMTLETLEDLKAHKASIQAIVKLKGWLNKHVLAGRVASQTVKQFEEDTIVMNDKVQAAVDASNKPE